MCAVEQFGGKRGGKDYMYLDEMLTRNLLKLDTIDTNGKESIRLARKEAIKCIQASIAVLEAKADLNLNEKKEMADTGETTNAKSSQSSDKPSDSANEKSTNDKMEIVDQSNANETKASDTSIPPEVQQNVENITINDDKTKSNETEKDDANAQTTKSESTEPTTEAAK